MQFGEKLKQLRTQHNMTQVDLAAKLGVTPRTLQNYENGKMYPKQTALFGKIAELFNVKTDYLLTDEDYYIMDAVEKGGRKSMRDVQTLVTEIGGLFAGGSLSEDDKEQVMMTINDLYWKAKQKNKKYTAKKHQKDSE